MGSLSSFSEPTPLTFHKQEFINVQFRRFTQFARDFGPENCI